MEVPTYNRVSKSPGRKPHGVRYPWESWLGRLPRVLVRGRDYVCESHCMAIIARRAAKRLKVPITIILGGDRVEIVRQRYHPARKVTDA